MTAGCFCHTQPLCGVGLGQVTLFASLSDPFMKTSHAPKASFVVVVFFE